MNADFRITFVQKGRQRTLTVNAPNLSMAKRHVYLRFPSAVIKKAEPQP